MERIVSCTREYSIGHRLMDYEGKCKHLHGHNYLIKVDVEGGGLNSQGMIIDFTTLKPMIERIVGVWDHKIILRKDDPLIPLVKDLTPIIEFDQNPTAEVMAEIICKRISDGLDLNPFESRIKIVVQETRDCYATYTE